MPEGPEIRIAADEIEAVLIKRPVTEVFFAFRRLKKYQKVFRGHKVKRVETRGKAMLTRFDNDLVIYSHNQLYGKWMTASSGVQPDTSRQLRLAIHNSRASAFLFSASDIEVIEAKNVDSHPFLKKLGPDLLSQTPTVPALIKRLRLTQFRNRQLSGLLLDQGFVAGLGNYLRAEILYFSGIYPTRRPADLSDTEIKKLATNIVKLTLRSYKTRGIINPPSLVKKLKTKGKKTRAQNRFSVFQREGESCYSCGAKITRMDSGGRHIFLCPRCQD